MSWSPPDVTRVQAVPVGPRRVSPDRNRRTDAGAGLITAVVCVLLGSPLGLLWSALAPHSHVAIEAGGAFIADAQSEVFIAGDGWFVGITALAGLLTGALAWWLGRRHGVAVVLGLTAGGAAAAYVASRVGVRVGQDNLLAVVHSGRHGTFASNVALQAQSALAAWPLAALATFAVLTASQVEERG